MSTDAEYRPFVVANDALGDPVRLRGLFAENSYLFFRGLLPTEDVLRVRRDLLELCRDAGWLHPDHDLVAGVWSGCEPPRGESDQRYQAVYRRVIHTPSFVESPHHPRLVAVAEQLLGGTVLVHPRKIGRITFPGNLATTTPPHQDYFYIRGAAETYTAWLPLGDCPRALGGLAVLKGSHHRGFLEHQRMQGTGGNGVVIADPAAEWHTADYQVGDVLFFHSHTVHRALHNLSGKHLRLSLDNRYQRAEDEIHPSSLGTHFNL